MKTLKDSSEILILCTVVFILQFAWVLGVDNPELRKMYPFSDQLVSVQAYMDYFFRDISYMVMIYLMAKFIPGMSDRLGVFFWLWLGYLCEYLLCYNEPFARIPIQLGSILLFTLPVSYSLFAGLTMIFITFYDILRK
jgi:hypothetical protein